jgi:GNAT superfamily N-acetyltransferase
MKIRKAAAADLPTLKVLHDRAVLELCSGDYTADQLESWINSSPLEKYYWRLERQRIFVAEEEGRPLGFVRWYPKTGELCSICVEPEFARQGVGTLLMEFAVEDAREHNVEILWLKASLNAVPFYGSLGWEYKELSKEGPLPYVKMEKHLT